MKTFKLNANNNLQFESNFEVLSGSEALIQDIRTLLLMFKGENPFDSSEGIDWYALMKKSDRNAILSAIKDRIKSDLRVKDISNIEFDIDKNQKMNVTLQIETTDGEIINV